MSALGGSFEASSLNEERMQEIAAQMLGGLPNADSAHRYSAGVLVRSGPRTTIDENRDDRVAAVITGKPRWATPELSARANDEGNAAALLAAYRDLGDGFIRCLSGTFALALIDYGRRKSFLAVDRMGVCPLCFSLNSSGDLVFGTTTTAVTAHPSVTSTVSNQSLYRFFYFHVVPSPATIFEHVAKLEPAQIICIEGSSVSRSFYWTPDPAATPGSATDADLINQLRTQTRNAIERSAPDERTGCFLSGGLDSSTVSGLANEHTNGRMRAYTIGFDQQGFDETSFARIAAKHFGLEHVEYYVTPSDVADAFDLLSTGYDEPFGNSSAIPAYFCAKRAKQDGVDRLLAGDGGDELFAGNERYATQILFQHYHKVPGALRSAVIEPLFRMLRFDRPVLLRKAWRYIEQAKIPMPDRLQTYNFLEMFPPASVFHGAFLDQVNMEAPLEEMRCWYNRSDGSDFLTRMLLFDWKLTLADNDIRKVNRMCEAAGIEVDYPLLDDGLVDFSLTLPGSLKLRRSDLRFAFKQAFSSYLPQQILEKEKHGFGLPFGEWLNTSDELRSKIMPCVERFRDRRILEDAFIDDMLHKHKHEHATYFGNMLWLIAVLENWLAARTS